MKEWLIAICLVSNMSSFFILFDSKKQIAKTEHFLRENEIGHFNANVLLRNELLKVTFRYTDKNDGFQFSDDSELISYHLVILANICQYFLLANIVNICHKTDLSRFCGKYCFANNFCNKQAMG